MCPEVVNQTTDILRQSEWDVVVIGAGVAGASFALQCASDGWKTLLVDKHTFPRTKVCGCCLNGAAVQRLQQLLGAESLSAIPMMSTQRIRFCHAGKSASVPSGGLAAVSRSVLDMHLVNRYLAAGGCFLQATTANVRPWSTYEDASHRQVALTQRSLHHSPVECSADSPNRDDGSVDRDADSSGQSIVTARLVAVCDGLGHPSLHGFENMRSVVAKQNRVGLGAEILRCAGDDAFPVDELVMAVGPEGYVGTVGVASDRLNIAAAVRPDALRTAESPGALLQSIYHQAGLPTPTLLNEAAIRGTGLLTRSEAHVALPRLILLGDATGYVEPFTGEGMAWALAASAAARSVVNDFLRGSGESGIENLWPDVHQRFVRNRQLICRLLSAGIQRPWLHSPMLTACRIFPSLANRLVRRLNQSGVPASRTL